LATVRSAYLPYVMEYVAT